MSEPETVETPTRKLSYDPSKLPNPMGATEHYSYAMLIEMRALRSILTRIANALEKQPIQSTEARIAIPDGVDVSEVSAIVNKMLADANTKTDKRAKTGS